MKHFVYCLTHQDFTLYIGKGSGSRLKNQRRAFGCDGHELARFKREKDAYAFEREAIKDWQPLLNIHPGGNGSRVAPKREPYDRDIAWIKRVGTRCAAAFILLGCAKSGYPFEPSNLEHIRQVAYAG